MYDADVATATCAISLDHSRMNEENSKHDLHPMAKTSDIAPDISEAVHM